MGIASANNVDFMIKGVFKFQAFGQELWVTTTEIGLSIVTIVILLIAIVTNVKMKKATEVPGTFQNITAQLGHRKNAAGTENAGYSVSGSAADLPLCTASFRHRNHAATV